MNFWIFRSEFFQTFPPLDPSYFIFLACLVLEVLDVIWSTWLVGTLQHLYQSCQKSRMRHLSYKKTVCTRMEFLTFFFQVLTEQAKNIFSTLYLPQLKRMKIMEKFSSNELKNDNQKKKKMKSIFFSKVSQERYRVRKICVCTIQSHNAM